MIVFFHEFQLFFLIHFLFTFRLIGVQQVSANQQLERSDSELRNINKSQIFRQTTTKVAFYVIFWRDLTK